jgi:uroporphyrin-III C-methyltransferase/precorrin-2 dehydrogenase/sirohydrochlorin ferrochelatase/uroporphyrin-III C-methyltransferase
MKKPFVYIVGAGPGDVELLTLKAYRLLTEVAEVVIYDRLIAEPIMQLVPSHVEKIYAGKSCHLHCMTQEEINETLLSQASKGKIIVRLKGGDPFIFGRGGEEAECLLAQHIPFEIVPGVTAASACGSVMGVPLTHRGLATGVQYITGHAQKGLPITLNWEKLANPDTTVVVYMGLANLEEICRQLMAHGLEASTPVMAIQDGTTAKQRYAVAELSTIAATVKEQQFQPPTLVIIGKVVGLRLWERN